LSIVGDNPERLRLHALARDLSIENQIIFHGAKDSGELAGLMNRHKIIVVPSRWPEPFGIVALEGIACGCVPVASSDGGLPEAVGFCGITFPSGNAEALAECLQTLLEDSAVLAHYQAFARTHLARFAARTIALRYIGCFQIAISRYGNRNSVAEAGSKSPATAPPVRKLF